MKKKIIFEIEKRAHRNFMDAKHGKLPSYDFYDECQNIRSLIELIDDKSEDLSELLFSAFEDVDSITSGNISHYKPLLKFKLKEAVKLLISMWMLKLSHDEDLRIKKIEL